MLIRHPADSLSIHHCRESVWACPPRVEGGTYRVYGRLIDPPLGQPSPGKPEKLRLEPAGAKGGLFQRPGTPHGCPRFGFGKPGRQQMAAELSTRERVAPVML